MGSLDAFMAPFLGQGAATSATPATSPVSACDQVLSVSQPTCDMPATSNHGAPMSQPGRSRFATAGDNENRDLGLTSQKSQKSQEAVPTPSDPAHVRYGVPADLDDWLGWYQSRLVAVKAENSKWELSRMVFSEAVEAWCARYWVPPAPGRCASCGNPSPDLHTGDGAAVCGDPDTWSCLIKYGTKRRHAAEAVLRRIGIFEQPIDDGGEPNV